VTMNSALVSTRLRMQVEEEWCATGSCMTGPAPRPAAWNLREHSAPDDPVYRDGRAFVAVKEFPAVPDPFLIYASSLAGPSRSGRLGHLVYLEALRRRSDLELQAYIGEVARVLRDCFPERGLDQDVSPQPSASATATRSSASWDGRFVASWTRDEYPRVSRLPLRYLRGRRLRRGWRGGGGEWGKTIILLRGICENKLSEGFMGRFSRQFL